MSKNILHTDSAPDAIGPYSQAVRTCGLVFTSGQLGIDPVTGALAPDARAQAAQSMRNIGAILARAGLDYGAIVKTTIFVKDLADFKSVNEVYASFFSGDYPARSCVQVAALPLNGLVEIECIAAE